MNNADQINQILKENTSYAAYRKCIREQFPEIDKLLDTSKYRYAEALYLFINGLGSRPACKFCNKELKYIDRTEGYGVYCSHKCYVNDGCGKEKREETNIKKFGNKCALGNKTVRKKRKDTMIKKYGSEFPLQNEELKLKAYESSKIIDYKKVTEKRKRTLVEKYGVDNLWNINGFRDKIEHTNLEKYGVKYSLGNKDIIKDISTTRLSSFFEILKNRFDDVKLVSTVDEYIGINKYNGGSAYNWKCKKCNNIFNDNVKYGYKPTCRKCNPGKFTRGELEIKEFLEELGIDFIIKDRTILKPKELDFLIHDHNIAIEYCGLYWHSEIKVHKNYHKEKFIECKENNIRLITIFEDEWLENKDICKSRLLHALKKDKVTCYARQTELKEIEYKITKEFLDKTHIQGTVASTINFGLYFKDMLVAVMTFGKLRKTLNSKSKDGHYELLRFSTIGAVPGAASKLFSHFKKIYNPEYVVSYCDLRWGNGSLYEKLGMNLVKFTEPGYWYSKDGIKRYHRSSFTKKSLLEKGLSGDTEFKIMDSLGYYRIWDCGNNKYEFYSSGPNNTVPLSNL
jgi:hypothetical protein